MLLYDDFIAIYLSAVLGDKLLELVVLCAILTVCSLNFSALLTQLALKLILNLPLIVLAHIQFVLHIVYGRVSQV